MKSYLFGKINKGYFSLPQKPTSIVLDMLSKYAKAPTQVVIHRDENLMYYCYIQKLNTQQYIGLCIESSNKMIINIDNLFPLFEQEMENICIVGEIIKFRRNSKHITDIDLLYQKAPMIAIKLNKFEEHFEKKFKWGDLLPRNYSLSKNHIQYFNINDNTEEIVHSSYSVGFTYIYKSENIHIIRNRDRNKKSKLNVLYIFGNGFDLAQGMKTSYNHFYTHLLNVVKTNTDVSNLLREMVEQIKENIETWSDLEIQLGVFTKDKQCNDFCQFYQELTRHLQEYLRQECKTKYKRRQVCRVSSVELAQIHKQNADFYNIIHNPSAGLKDTDKSLFYNFIDKSKEISPHFISLNYTETIDYYLTDARFQSSASIPDVKYLHGKLGKTIILGVDNTSQISNTNADFIDNKELMYYLIKQKSYEGMEQHCHTECECMIKTAKVIVLYGVSLGETDKYWWELIGKQLRTKKGVVIIYYFYTNQLTGQNDQQRKNIKENAEKLFRERMGISENDFTNCKHRVLIQVNSPIFNLN